MVAVKHHQADAFLKAIDARVSAVLLYGPDAGLVMERASTLARMMAARDDPPGEIISFEDSDLDTDSDRLSVELQTLPMFGGRKIIRARTGRRIGATLLKPLIEAGGLAGFLIVEGGDLRPDEALRAAFEKSASAAAVACFGDDAEGLEALAHKVLKGYGIAIAPDVLTLLASRLGADRALSRGELEKLALYVQGRGMVDADDVAQVVGDASDLRLDGVPEAAASGDGARALRDADRAVASGEGVQAVLLATQRYFLRLHRIAASAQRGRSIDEAVRAMRPPIHFKAQGLVIAQLRNWTLPKLAKALRDIATTIAACRQTGALDETLMERLLLRLAFLSRNRQSA